MDQASIRRSVFILVVVMAATHCLPFAQAAVAPAGVPTYEVASIHQNMNPNPRWNISFTADGFHAMDVTLFSALQVAYGVMDRDVWSGGPAWLDKARFDIEAKYDVSKYPNLTREQRQVMLQQFLADRFKVVVHHISKEFPLYAMVVAKDGPKFAETKPEDQRKNPTYGVMCMVRGGRRGTMEMRGCTTTQLANDLGGYGRLDLGRKVVDQTALTGHYTFELHWAPVESPNPSSGELSPSEPSGPSIFTAVKEQLGLQLKPIKGPLDTIVIDHAEMPTDN